MREEDSIKEFNKGSENNETKNGKYISYCTLCDNYYIYCNDIDITKIVSISHQT